MKNQHSSVPLTIQKLAKPALLKELESAYEDIRKLKQAYRENNEALNNRLIRQHFEIKALKQDRFLIAEKAWLSGFWLSLNEDNNDLATRKSKFKKWFETQIK